MKNLLIPAFAAVLALASVPQARAAGCLTGAAVGGVAGHMVGSGHGLAGAAVGCAVGHHSADKKAAAAQNAAPAGSQPATH